MKRISSVLLGAALLLLPFFLLGAGGGDSLPLSSALWMGSGRLTSYLEGYLNLHLPWVDQMAQWNLSIRAFGGQREYNQVFICGDELIRDIDPPVEYSLRENAASILEFAERGSIPTYCMIVPTASAIRQQSLPPFTQTQMVNQKQIIEDVYSEMVGRVTVADTYPVLFNARDQYLYYRTEDNLTSLGGFYLYTVLGPKLLEGVARPSLADYDIEFVKNDFYGSLYQKSPYKDARADSLAIFRYTKNPRQYLVKKDQDGALKTYHTLYPLHMLDLSREMDVFLGGLSAITTIEANSPYRASLLVFGDKTALAYLPFLVNHYSTVTLVDLFQLSSQGYDSLSLLDYDQVLFGYSIETFMHYNIPSRANRLLDTLDD